MPHEAHTRGLVLAPPGRPTRLGTPRIPPSSVTRMHGTTTTRSCCCLAACASLAAPLDRCGAVEWWAGAAIRCACARDGVIGVCIADPYARIHQWAPRCVAESSGANPAPSSSAKGGGEGARAITLVLAAHTHQHSRSCSPRASASSGLQRFASFLALSPQHQQQRRAASPPGKQWWRGGAALLMRGGRASEAWLAHSAQPSISDCACLLGSTMRVQESALPSTVGISLMARRLFLQLRAAARGHAYLAGGPASGLAAAAGSVQAAGWHVSDDGWTQSRGDPAAPRDPLPEPGSTWGQQHAAWQPPSQCKHRLAAVGLQHWAAHRRGASSSSLWHVTSWAPHRGLSRCARERSR